MSAALDYITQDLLGLICFSVIGGSAVLCLLALIFGALRPDPNTSTRSVMGERNLPWKTTTARGHTTTNCSIKSARN